MIQARFNRMSVRTSTGRCRPIHVALITLSLILPGQSAAVPDYLDLLASTTIGVTARCTLHVLTQDLQGPLPGALVHLLEKGKKTRVIPADVDGHVSFTDLNTITTYAVVASFPGYRKDGKETTCPTPDRLPVVLTLVEPGPTWPSPPEPKKNRTPQKAVRLP